MSQHPTRIVLVTGMSGAGKSSALKVLEDLGYEAFDNIPLPLISGLLQEVTTGPGRSAVMGDRGLAIGLDSRTRGFDVDALQSRINSLRGSSDYDTRLVFLDCTDEVLRQRFTETRRRHPLAVDGVELADGIASERVALAPARDHADLVIDTTDFAPKDLRTTLAGELSLESGPGLSIAIISFSYRRGVPREADLLFDMRFLRNPHYEAGLRALTGADRAVEEYIVKDPSFGPAFEKISDLVLNLVPGYVREGKSYLTIAFGCTGGRHRSVFAAEAMRDRLHEAGHRASVRHREIGTDS